VGAAHSQPHRHAGHGHQEPGGHQGGRQRPRHARWSAFFAANVHLAGAGEDYFDDDRALSPFQHYWSLAVEEQFYLVWPLLLLLLGRRHLAGALAVGVVASLAYAIVLGPEAYFSTPARVWELGLGALLAARPPRRRSRAAGWAGLAAIAVAAMTSGPDSGVPLLAALGAAAAIAAGGPRVLALAPVQRVGRLSYAWYVWHWPVLVFAAAAAGPLSRVEGLAFAAASLLPAVVTYRWIEEPIRRAPLHAPRMTLAAAPAAAAATLVAGIALSALMPATPTLANADGARRLELQRSATALKPPPQDADDDRGRSHDCLAGAGATTAAGCDYGHAGSPTTAVLFGDSHAMQYFPALEPIASSQGWRLVQIAKAGCPPSAVSVVYAPSMREYPECDAWREDALRRIEAERPALVLVAGSARYTVVEDGHRLDARLSLRRLAAGHAPVLDRLAAAAERVVVLGDPPIPPFYVPDCVAEALDDLRRCAFAAGRATKNARAVNAAIRRSGAELIDPTSRFCLRDRCPAVIGDVLVYRNTGHITASYMETMAPWLQARLSP
jgi:hypothetical protein